MLTGPGSGHGAEPMDIMRGAQFDRPVLHRPGNHIGYLWVPGLVFIPNFAQTIVYVARQAFPHGAVIEQMASEQAERILFQSFSLSLRRCARKAR